GVGRVGGAAGRNASACLARLLFFGERGSPFWGWGAPLCDFCLDGFMDARLEPMEVRVATASIDELVVGAVLHQPSAIDGDDAVGQAHGGQAMGNNKDRPALGDLPHVVLDDPLTL